MKDLCLNLIEQDKSDLPKKIAKMKKRINTIIKVQEQMYTKLKGEFSQSMQE